jgi:hypothetical protein
LRSDDTQQPHYLKPTTWIVTPRVRDVVRRHFNCSRLRGMALEDVPIVGSAFVHWEARLAGPEVRYCRVVCSS